MARKKFEIIEIKTTANPHIEDVIASIHDMLEHRAVGEHFFKQGIHMGRFIREKETNTIVTGFQQFLRGAMSMFSDDDHWESILEDARTPCGGAECTCHIMSDELFKVLTSMREYVNSCKRRVEAEDSIRNSNDQTPPIHE